MASFTMYESVLRRFGASKKDESPEDEFLNKITGKNSKKILEFELFGRYGLSTKKGDKPMQNRLEDMVETISGHIDTEKFFYCIKDDRLFVSQTKSGLMSTKKEKIEKDGDESISITKFRFENGGWNQRPINIKSVNFDGCKVEKFVGAFNKQSLSKKIDKNLKEIDSLEDEKQITDNTNKKISSLRRKLGFTTETEGDPLEPETEPSSGSNTNIVLKFPIDIFTNHNDFNLSYFNGVIDKIEEDMNYSGSSIFYILDDDSLYISLDRSNFNKNLMRYNYIQEKEPAYTEYRYHNGQISINPARVKMRIGFGGLTMKIVPSLQRLREALRAKFTGLDDSKYISSEETIPDVEVDGDQPSPPKTPKELLGEEVKKLAVRMAMGRNSR